MKILISGCAVFIVIVVIVFFAFNLQFTSTFPFIGTSAGTTTNGSSSGSGQPEITAMELKMWVSDATKNDIVHKTDVAKWGLYTSEFTFKASNTASISRVKISLVDPSGVAVNKKDGTPFVRIPDDDGLPTFIKAPTESDTYGMDKVAGDGIFTTGVTGELVEMSKWCSFPEGQYQLKVDITVNDSSLKDVTASYPIYIAKNCE